MISQVNDDCLQMASSEQKTPAQLVFIDSLKEFYWSKNFLMRTLLKLSNVAVNCVLQRKLGEYFEICRSQFYSTEHIFELLDEEPEGRMCTITEGNCRKAMAMLHQAERSGESRDKAIRSCTAEFFAYEITALEFLMKLAMSMDRMDIARVIAGMQKQMRTAFDQSLQISNQAA